MKKFFCIKSVYNICMKVQGLSWQAKNGVVREIKNQDIPFLAAGMIKEDREYCRREGYGENTLRAVLSHIFNSSFCFSAEDSRGRLILSFGCIPQKDGVCTIWSFATKELLNIKNSIDSMEFFSVFNQILDFINDIYPVIIAYIHKDNISAKKRMNFGGFKLSALEGETAIYLRD
jgi:hypothetical protein